MANGHTNKGPRIQATAVYDWDTGLPAEAGGGAGTSNTTEATQLLVKTAVETRATSGATSALQATLNTQIGATNETAATADTGTFGLNALIKRALAHLSTMLTSLGAPADAAWTTGSGSHTALLKAIAATAVSTTPTQVAVRASEYETVAASQTDQMMGAAGAIGDTIDGILVIPSSTTVGAISIEDGSTNTTVYAGGTVGADLKPFFIPLFGIASVSGGWEVTTGAGASALVFGQFT